MEQLWSSWSRLSKLRENRTQRGKAVRCKDELSSAVWRLSYSERNNLLQTFLHNSYMNKLRSRAPLRLYCSFCVSNEFSAHYSGGQRWKRKDSFSYRCRAVNKQVMSVFVCLHESCRSRRLSLSLWIIKLRSGLHQEARIRGIEWESTLREQTWNIQIVGGQSIARYEQNLKKYTNRIRCSASPAGRLHDDVSSSQPGSSAAPTDDSARSQISSPVYICKLNMFQMLDYQPSYRGTCPEAPRLRSSRGPERFMLVNWFVGVIDHWGNMNRCSSTSAHMTRSLFYQLILSRLCKVKRASFFQFCVLQAEKRASGTRRLQRSSMQLLHSSLLSVICSELLRVQSKGLQHAKQTFTTCVCSGLRHMSSLVKLRKRFWF